MKWCDVTGHSSVSAALRPRRMFVVLCCVVLCCVVLCCVVSLSGQRTSFFEKCVAPGHFHS